MNYTLLPDNSLEVLLEEPGPLVAMVGPHSSYRVYYTRATGIYPVELFTVPDYVSGVLTVKAMGYGPLPMWEQPLQLQPDHREHFLPEPTGEEEVIIARDVSGREIPLTLRHVLRMHLTMSMLIARNIFTRKHMSERRRDMIGINEWLTEAYRRYQFANGLAVEWQRRSGGYTDPYGDNCKPLPDGWVKEIGRLRHSLLTMFDNHEMKSDRKEGKTRGFWDEWHAQWDTDILVRIRDLAQPYGWVKVNNPTSVERVPFH